MAITPTKTGPSISIFTIITTLVPPNREVSELPLRYVATQLVVQCWSCMTKALFILMCGDATANKMKKWSDHMRLVDCMMDCCG